MNISERLHGFECASCVESGKPNQTELNMRQQALFETAEGLVHDEMHRGAEGVCHTQCTRKAGWCSDAFDGAACVTEIS
jgi:hypothetical protein